MSLSFDRNNLSQSPGKVAIFWDCETCPASNDVSGCTVVQNIRRIALLYGHITSFRAYMELSDTSEKSINLRSELQTSSVSLVDCRHDGGKDAADKMMIVYMLSFAIDNPSPATIMLISGDRDFGYAISTLQNGGYTVPLITPPSSHATLRAQATKVFDWFDVVPSPVADVAIDLKLKTSPLLHTRDRSITPPLHHSPGVTYSSDTLPAAESDRPDSTSAAKSHHANGAKPATAYAGHPPTRYRVDRPGEAFSSLGADHPTTFPQRSHSSPISSINSTPIFSPLIIPETNGLETPSPQSLSPELQTSPNQRDSSSSTTSWPSCSISSASSAPSLAETDGPNTSPTPRTQVLHSANSPNVAPSAGCSTAGTTQTSAAAPSSAFISINRFSPAAVPVIIPESSGSITNPIQSSTPPSLGQPATAPTKSQHAPATVVAPSKPAVALNRANSASLSMPAESSASGALKRQASAPATKPPRRWTLPGQVAVVPPHFTVLLDILEEHQRAGDTAYCSQVADKLIRKDSQVYVRAGISGSKGRFKQYLAGAISAGLVRSNGSYTLTLLAKRGA